MDFKIYFGESSMQKHKVFISYHHAKDQKYKEELLKLNEQYDLFIDVSVDTGDIDDNLPDERIREIIRDEYLRDSTITILLVGEETRCRKHIDWELYSSMYNGKINKQSGIIVVQLDYINPQYVTAPFEEEKKILYPNYTWTSIDSRAEYERRYPYLPERIIDNLLNKDAKIPVTKWDTIINNPEGFGKLIDLTFEHRLKNKYDLSRPMRKRNC